MKTPKKIKIAVAVFSVGTILVGLISIIAGVQWKPLFVIKQKEIIKERVIEPKIVEIEKVKIQRVGEEYTELDRELLTFCLESGKLNCNIKSTTDWSYWQNKKKQLDELENKLLKDKLIQKR